MTSPIPPQAANAAVQADAITYSDVAGHSSHSRTGVVNMTPTTTEAKALLKKSAHVWGSRKTIARDVPDRTPIRRS